MCQGDDKNCPEFHLHRRQFMAELGHERRSFLKSAVAAAGGISAAAGGLSLVSPALAQAAEAAQPAKRGYHYVPATAETVHWGYFSKLLKPLGRGRVRRLRHHRDADPPRQRRRRAHGQGRSGRRERLLLGQGQRRASNRRGAGPMDADAVRPRRRRGPRRAHLHRAGRREAAPSPATSSRCASST